MAIINSWPWCKGDANCSGIPQKSYIELLALHIPNSRSYLIFKSVSSPYQTRTYIRPCQTTTKEKLNQSVRSRSDVRFDGINHMIERSSKQQRCKLESCTFKTTSFCEKCEAY
ncbi:hypothetical protein AVEN_250850-1 [Araneus ventricosus]|uniref:Uncharacterized protein n=1 Tax=Araneus ventricosus TaxID=182803 RepID=A0A4Y2NRJ7_ARAVE|nr:hypothetical protein AVEN_250850-1 [Araneus ventricosus]